MKNAKEIKKSLKAEGKRTLIACIEKAEMFLNLFNGGEFRPAYTKTFIEYKNSIEIKVGLELLDVKLKVSNDTFVIE